MMRATADLARGQVVLVHEETRDEYARCGNPGSVVDQATAESALDNRGWRRVGNWQIQDGLCPWARVWPTRSPWFNLMPEGKLAEPQWQALEVYGQWLWNSHPLLEVAPHLKQVELSGAPWWRETALRAYAYSRPGKLTSESVGGQILDILDRERQTAECRREMADGRDPEDRWSFDPQGLLESS